METDRALSSRLCLPEHDQKTPLDRQIDETNRRYYRKSLTLLANLIDSLFDDNSPEYAFSLSSFLIELLDLCEVGVV